MNKAKVKPDVKPVRPVYEIAKEIRKDWIKPYFGAIPYLAAMSSLTSISNSYGCDSGKSVVLYFLSNASTWRGPKAVEIKKELKSICNIK